MEGAQMTPEQQAAEIIARWCQTNTTFADRAVYGLAEAGLLMDENTADLLSRFAALDKYFSDETESYEILSIPVAIANVRAARLISDAWKGRK